MEKFLSDNPEFEISQKYLIDGKYLKEEYEVHHINLNYQDNRIDNLWVFKNNEEHHETRRSLYGLVEELLNTQLIQFRDGKYSLITNN